MSDKTPWRNRGTQDSLLFQTEDFCYNFTWPSKRNVIKLRRGQLGAKCAPGSLLTCKQDYFLDGPKEDKPDHLPSPPGFQAQSEVIRDQKGWLP